jgi:hypothetical protein
MIFWVLFACSVGMAAYVRLAPDVVARWHQPLEEMATAAGIVSEPGGARAIVPMADGRAGLARFAAVAEASPRVRLLAGSVEEGRMTWVARSALWGFPDYITAEATPAGTGASLTLYARLRFGSSDMGVNAARLRDWLSRL